MPTVHARLQPPDSDSAGIGPRRRRRRAALFVLFCGVFGLIWAVRPNPHMARAKALQQELFTAGAKALSPDERKAKFVEFRNEMKQLSDDQKWELGAPMREKQKAEMNRYFAMSAKEKVQFLDERIDRMERMRKSWEKTGGKGGNGGGPFGPGGPPRGTVGAVSGGATGQGNRAGAAGAPPGRSPPSPADREQRRKQLLDRTTPEDRAQMDQFRRDLNARRAQRGLPVTGR